MPHVIARALVRVPPQITPSPPPPPTSPMVGSATFAFIANGDLVDGGSNFLLDDSGNILTDDSGNPLTNA